MRFIGFILVLWIAGCSGRSKTQVGTVPVTPAPIPQPTSTPQSPFNGGSLNSGLFDRTSSSDPRPTATPSAQPQVFRENDVACLSRDYGLFGYGTPYGYSAGYGAFANAVNAEPTRTNLSIDAIGCVRPEQPSFGRDFFLDEALTTMGGMRECFDFVASRRPSQNASPEAVEAHFDGAKRAMVRCYRLILARQVRIAEWSEPSVNRFNQVDANLFFLLNQLNSQQGF